MAIGISRLARTALVALALAGVSACAPTQQVAAPVDFSQAPPIVLTVAQVELLNLYTPAPDAAGAEADLPTSPADAVQNWATSRLRAGGGPGIATLTIREASVTRTMLSTQGGLGGVFSDEKNEQLTLRIVADLSVSGGMGGSTASTAVTVGRQLSFPKSYTLAERRNEAAEALQRAMQDFDAQMENGVRANLSQYTTY